MDYMKLGRTGLEVSRICLGCMSYTVNGPDAKHGWLFDEEGSKPFYARALDLGINFFDTANAYSAGQSEEVLGRQVIAQVPRDEVVILSKVFNRMRPGPNGAGLSRKAILDQIDGTLRRLGTDHVDVYMIHRWDYATPVEETLEALHDVVKAGKARYLGASSMFAWQLAKAVGIQKANGWAPFVAMQNHLNLLYREEEREMLPFCRDAGIGVIPWSPLARGRLARPWGEASVRSAQDGYTPALYAAEVPEELAIAGRVVELAARRGVKPAQIAMAWLWQKEPVVAPVMGATKPEQLDDAAAALSLSLSSEEVAYLEEPYRPRAVIGFS
ncbi:aldo/keto reductase [Mangrovicoccus sp. HB161399]|uniref:aldo/keto reductase n=1 Tax=Mangrovicoccus sp. HB161399 TaxID=2720392 RepID=UPI001556CAEB|nr:aldo/keto reductase [Mangrovicoccus sp. HB161399]